MRKFVIFHLIIQEVSHYFSKSKFYRKVFRVENYVKKFNRHSLLFSEM